MWAFETNCLGSFFILPQQIAQAPIGGTVAPRIDAGTDERLKPIGQGYVNDDGTHSLILAGLALIANAKWQAVEFAVMHSRVFVQHLALLNLEAVVELMSAFFYMPQNETEQVSMETEAWDDFFSSPLSESLNSLHCRKFLQMILAFLEFAIPIDRVVSNPLILKDI